MLSRTNFYRVPEGISGRFRGRYTDFGHVEFGSREKKKRKEKAKEKLVN